MVSQAFFAPLSSYFVYDVAVAFGSPSMVAPLGSIAALAPQFALCLALNELLFYAFHRLLHTPMLYNAIHKKHHQVILRPFMATI